MSDNNSIPAPPPRPTVDPTAAEPAPTALSAKRGLAVAALIVGVVAILCAIIPGLSFVAWLPALAAAVLGIVALVRKGGGRGMAVAGVVLGPVALLVAIAVSVGAIVGAVSPDVATGSDDRPTPVDSAPDEPAAQELADPVGSRSNPAPAGSTIVISDNSGEIWEVTIGAPNFNAGDVIAAENQFNPPADAGMQYVMVPVTYTYVGSLSGTPWMDVTVEFVSAAGTTHPQEFVVIPTPISDIDEMYEGATATGNLVVMAPAENIEAGTWAISTFLSEKYFVAVQ